MDSRPLLWAPAESNDRVFSYTEPTKKTKTAAAYDIYLPCDVLLGVGTKTRVNLNLLCAMPEDERANLEMRSGLADKYGLIVLAGVIESDYADSWGAIIYTPRPEDINDIRFLEDGHKDRVYYDATCQDYFLRFKKGERMVQATFTKIPRHDPKTVSMEEVKAVIASYGSSRAGGFGSTGA